jgi:hypothetical protein
MNWNYKMFVMTLLPVFAALHSQSAVVNNSERATIKLLAVTNSLVEREITICGPPGQTNAQLSAERILVPSGGTRVENNLLVVYHRQTGFTWWTLGGQSLQDVEQLAAENEFWVIPEVGIAKIHLDNGGIQLWLFKDKAASVTEARSSVATKIQTMLSDGPRLVMGNDVILVPLNITVGDSFFARPGDAAPQPRPKIRSCSYTNKLIQFELESAITKERTIFEMDPDFRVRRAYRAGTLRFDRDSSDPLLNGSWRTNTGIPGVIDLRDSPPPNK